MSDTEVMSEAELRRAARKARVAAALAALKQADTATVIEETSGGLVTLNGGGDVDPDVPE